MMAANGFVVSAAVVSLNSAAEKGLVWLFGVSIGLSAFGILVLCLIWLQASKRRDKFYDCWAESAHELEKHLCTVRTMACGRELQESLGGFIGVKIKHFRHFMIYMFMLVYALLILLATCLLQDC
jgi:hypothetical protein